MINKITDDWTGYLNTSKWAKICKCSQDTASRDMKDLVDKKLFVKISNGPHTRFEITY